MHAAIAILAVAAVVWALVYARHGSLLVGGALFVVVGYVFTHEYWGMWLGPVKLTCGRVLLVGLVGLFAWRWRQGQIERRCLTGSDWLAALFLGYLTLRYLATPDAAGTTGTVSPTWRIIACFWMPAALYFVVRNAELNERCWKAMLVCLSALGGYLAITGIAEVSGQWWAVFPRFIADPTLGTHFSRARGPALTSVSLGFVLTCSFWATWFLWERVGRAWKLCLLGLMVLDCVTLYFTYTRSTWLGLAAGLAVIPLLHWPRSWRPVVATGMSLVLLVGGLSIGQKLVSMGRGDTSGSAAHSVYQRASFLFVSMQMFRDAPLVGCGFGRFYDSKMPYLSDRSQQIELESIRKLDHHNTFLSILNETGLIGLVLLVAMLGAWTRAAWQLARDTTASSWIRAHGLFTLALIIAYGVNGMFHDMTLLPSEQWLLCLAAGVTVGIRSVAAARCEDSRVATRHLARLVSAAADTATRVAY